MVADTLAPYVTRPPAPLYWLSRINSSLSSLRLDLEIMDYIDMQLMCVIFLDIHDFSSLSSEITMLYPVPRFIKMSFYQ